MICCAENVLEMDRDIVTKELAYYAICHARKKIHHYQQVQYTKIVSTFLDVVSQLYGK